MRLEGEGLAGDPLVLRRFTDEVMFELRELSEQKYVERYAARKGTVEDVEPARVAHVAPVAAA